MSIACVKKNSSCINPSFLHELLHIHPDICRFFLYDIYFVLPLEKLR